MSGFDQRIGGFLHGGDVWPGQGDGFRVLVRHRLCARRLVGHGFLGQIHATTTAKMNTGDFGGDIGRAR
jgi:hypothetical protein